MGVDAGARIVGSEESFDEAPLSGPGGEEGLAADLSTGVAQAMAITTAILAPRATADLRRHRRLNLPRLLTSRPAQDPETRFAKGRV